MTYKVQIDDLVRDANAEEIELIESHQAEAEAKAKAEVEKATAKTALLDRLGITPDEAALLLK
jgi:hypothetical protein